MTGTSSCPSTRPWSAQALPVSEIRHVYLAGGSSNFPPIVYALWDYFHFLAQPQRLDAFFAVSQGAVVCTFLREGRTWEIRETLHNSLFLKRRGRPFLEVLSQPIPVPSPPRRRELQGFECPFFGAGGRSVRLEFFQGTSADDPFMTLAHVERLELARALAEESRLVSVEGSLDQNKVFHFALHFEDARSNELIRAQVDFRSSSEMPQRGDGGTLPPGLVLNGERV